MGIHPPSLYPDPPSLDPGPLDMFKLVHLTIQGPQPSPGTRWKAVVDHRLKYLLVLDYQSERWLRGVMLNFEEKETYLMYHRSLYIRVTTVTTDICINKVSQYTW